MEKGKRQANFELLRIVAMGLIITLHFLRHSGLLNPEDESVWFNIAMYWIDSLACCAVNLYVLISGYFLVKSKFSWKKVFLLIAQVLFYSIIIYALFLGFDRFITHSGAFSLKEFLKGPVLPVITGQYWFVTSYVILYILSPFLNLFITHISQSAHRLFIIISGFAFSVIPTFFNGIASSEWTQKNGFSFVWFIVLYFIAAYFRLYGFPVLKKWKLFLTFIISGTLPEIISLLQYYVGILVRGRPFDLVEWDLYNTLPILTSSIALFVFFSQTIITHVKVSKTILFLASHSFGVYLIHDNDWTRPLLWLDVIAPRRFINSPLIFLILPATVLGIYLACCLIDQVRAWLFIPLQRSKRLNALFAKLDAKTNAMLSPIDTEHEQRNQPIE